MHYYTSKAFPFPFNERGGSFLRGLPLSFEVVSKPHLRLNDCVVPRIEMLTYLRVRSASNTRDALSLNLI